MGRILIVDDEVSLRRVLSVILTSDSHEVAEASGVAEARHALTGTQIDLVITDQKMPDGDGLDVLAASRDADASIPVIFLTAHATVDLAVDAMRAGAFDFLIKPFVPEHVLAAVRRGLERVDLVRTNERLKGAMRRLDPAEVTLGASPMMAQATEHLARVAGTNATVLITGETGVGKELAARAIHRLSPRAEEPFIAVNCAAFPDTLLESELFGHERGAFTGAAQGRVGLFETAHRGTLFLDEAGEMSLGMQAKLLRVLADGSIFRVGSSRQLTVNVRLIVATHRDLKLRVEEGLFRDDLYYRLAVVPIVIPPLRERRSEIPALVHRFLTEIALELKAPRKTIGAAALARLAGYDFPGNVRELRNARHRAYPGRLWSPADALRAECRPDRRRGEIRGARAGLYLVPDRRRSGAGAAPGTTALRPRTPTSSAAVARTGVGANRRGAIPRRGSADAAGRRDSQCRTATGRAGETARHQQLLPRQRSGQMAHERPALPAGAIQGCVSGHRSGVLRQSPATGIRLRAGPRRRSQ